MKTPLPTTATRLAVLLTLGFPTLSPAGDASSFLAIAGNGTLGSTVGGAQSGFEIQATTDKSEALAKLAYELSEGSQFSTVAITASAPLAKTGDTSLASIDGLADGFNLELKLTKFITPRGNPAWHRHPDEFEAICQAVAAGATAQGYEAIAKKAAGGEIDLDDVLRFAPQFGTQFENRTRPPGARDYTWGVAAKVGHQSYSYLTTPGLEKTSTDKVPWSAKIFGGVIPARGNTLIVLSYEYQHAFEKEDAKSFLLPADDSGLQEVKTGPIKGPKTKDKQLIAVEVRRLISLPNLKYPIGFNLKLTYDLESDHFGAEMPLWLIRDAKGNLTGGLTASWLEKDHTFTVGVIIGGGFTFF